MPGHTDLPDRTKQDDRGDRILDSAAELLLRLGYRKVTIEDIARHAHIGKGTVYLHWRTKDQLFEALLTRESIDLVDELLSRLRANSAEVLPHRFIRATFLATVRRPLLKALFTKNIEVLGKLVSGKHREHKHVANAQFFDLMNRYGLVRDDIANLPYLLQASTVGFYLLDALDPDAAELEAEAKADALETVVHACAVPAQPPSEAVVSKAASELAEFYEQLISTYRTWIYSPNPERGPG